METEYKILLLEENKADAELIMDQVSMSGLKFIFKRSENETDFKEKVGKFRPQLILSAYSLTTYNGMDALKYVLGNYPDIPLIVVTASINEETAVACMKAGAVDYILKDKMHRLGLAVKKALENKEIKIQNCKLSTALNYSPVAIALLDTKATIEYTNSAFQNLTGYTGEQLLGKNMISFTAGIPDLGFHKKIMESLLKGNEQSEKFLNKNKEGKEYWVSAKIAPIKNLKGEITGLIELQEDITQHIENKKHIENDLQEKELLLQEIYHRVNNNMQIMISLFNMQIQRTDKQSEKNILIYAMSRVGAMSAIHSDIYQERSFVAIDFANVTRHIFNTLCDSLMVLCRNFELKVEAEIPDFGLDLAQPCALIVNELISNSIRHAYPDGKGLIYVSLTINEADELTLLVKDNGVGIPDSIDPESSDSTGFSLVYLLGKGQLDGTVGFNRDNGTTVTIKFKKIEDHKRF